MKTLLPKSLFARSFLILAVPVLVLQALSMLIFFNTHWDNLSRRLAINLAGEIALLAQMLEEDGLEATRKAAAALDIRVDILPESSLKEALPGEDQSPMATRELYRELAMRLGVPFAIRQAADDRDVLEVRLHLPDRRMARLSLNRKKVYSATALVFIGWSAGLSVLLLAIAWVFLRNQIRPVLRLARAANTFGLHNQQTWLRPQGAQEIRTAIMAFNRMQERILQHLEQRTIMLAGISHDLRTPLTRLRLQLGLLEDDLPADSRTDMLADVQDMETMVNSYLAFARGDTHEDSEAVPLAAWLEDTLAPWRKQDNVHLSLPDKNLKVLMQPQAMRRALANVVDNALQYGTAVWIDVTSGTDTVRLSVADNGCGIPPEQYDNALKPFFRLNTARPSTQGHVGLGLAVAQQIVQQQGGSLGLEKATQGGLMVVAGLQRA